MANEVHLDRASAPEHRRPGFGARLAGVVPALFGICALLLLATVPAVAEPARTTADLNLREGPGTRYRVIAAMPRGSLVDVRACTDAWCEVGYRGRVGWASRRYLRIGAVPVRPAPAPVRPAPERVPLFPPFLGEGPLRPAPAVCSARRVRWLIGERATERRLEAALEASGARRLRVEEPGRFYTQDFRPDRLTVEVDRRDVVVDVACR
ncbi:MAG: I78 family peptidase inhibitor [Salinarimonas sp.]